MTAFPPIPAIGGMATTRDIALAENSRQVRGRVNTIGNCPDFPSSWCAASRWGAGHHLMFRSNPRLLPPQPRAGGFEHYNFLILTTAA